MTEAEWLSCTDPAPMLRYLQERQAGERKFRLLACACCRGIWALLPDPRSRQAVEVAERFADDPSLLLDLCRARVRAVEAACGASWAAYWTANIKAYGAIGNVFLAASSSADVAEESRRQVGLVYEVFGNPFHAIPPVSACLTSDVTTLGGHIYHDRAFHCMPELAEALEDAGCADADLLDHIRSPGPHVRGCWALDLVLGRG